MFKRIIVKYLRNARSISLCQTSSSSPVIYWWISVLTTPRNRKPVPLVDHQKPGIRNGIDKIEKESNLVNEKNQSSIFAHGDLSHKKSKY